MIRDPSNTPKLTSAEVEELLGTLASVDRADAHRRPRRHGEAPNDGSDRLSVWASYGATSEYNPVILPEDKLEQLMRSGSSVAITPALGRALRGMIYGDADARFDYYLELINNGRLFCRYNRIIGSRYLGQVDPEMLDRLLQGQQSRQQVSSGESADGGSKPATSPSASVAELPLRSPASDDEDDAGSEATRKVADDVLVILRQCSADEIAVYLPARQLDPKLYKRVNDVLVALGGKWNRSIKGHKFGEDPREVLAAVQQSGAYMNAKDFGFFPTPAALAREVVDLAELEPGMSVYEPSAGGGAIADAAAEVVGAANVHTSELLPKNAATLRAKGYSVSEGDFLSMEPTTLYDRVIMNPPFGGQADMKHVTHAARFLKPDGRLVAIMSPSFEFRSTKTAAAFRELLEQAGDHKEDVAAGTFRESGTDVRTVIVAIDAARLPWNQADTDRHAHQRQRAA